MTATDTRIGIEIPGIYDGISVWVEPDGTYTNRWADYARDHPEDRGIQARAAATQQWIDQHTQEDA